MSISTVFRISRLFCSVLFPIEIPNRDSINESQPGDPAVALAFASIFHPLVSSSSDIFSVPQLMKSSLLFLYSNSTRGCVLFNIVISPPFSRFSISAFAISTLLAKVGCHPRAARSFLVFSLSFIVRFRKPGLGLFSNVDVHPFPKGCPPCSHSSPYFINLPESSRQKIGRCTSIVFEGGGSIKFFIGVNILFDFCIFLICTGCP